jgi:hypothetical protein
VYLADGTGGLSVISVADPANPDEVAYYDTPGWASEVAIAAGRVYVADRDGGLVTLSYTLPVYLPLAFRNATGS